MQAQMVLQQAQQQFLMSEYGNAVLEQCWDICYHRNMQRDELAKGEVPTATLQKMDACGRKCANREFEVLKLTHGYLEQRAREMEQMM